MAPENGLAPARRFENGVLAALEIRGNGMARSWGGARKKHKISTNKLLNEVISNADQSLA
jgi:hypothetical protein